MAESLAPIDESVKIPDSVKAQAAQAEAYYQTPEQTPEPPAAEAAPAQTPEPEAPAPTPSLPEAPEAQPDRVSELEAKLAKQQRDYNALLNRWRQREAHPQRQPEPPPRTFAEQPPPTTRPLVTEEERKAYGDEALSVMERKAREVVIPVVEHFTNQTKQLHQELQRVKVNDVYTTLDSELQNWREINATDDWKLWLGLPDLYSGVVRQQLLEQALAAGDASRVLAFFQGYLAENPGHMGQQTSDTTPVPPEKPPVRKAAIDLKRLAAPGRASPSPPPSATAPAPVITTKDIAQFYWDVTHGRYDGRAEAKAKREGEIHAAAREGRVQQVKK